MELHILWCSVTLCPICRGGIGSSWQILFPRPLQGQSFRRQVFTLAFNKVIHSNTSRGFQGWSELRFLPLGITCEMGIVGSRGAPRAPSFSKRALGCHPQPLSSPLFNPSPAQPGLGLKGKVMPMSRLPLSSCLSHESCLFVKRSMQVIPRNCLHSVKCVLNGAALLLQLCNAYLMFPPLPLTRLIYALLF